MDREPLTSSSTTDSLYEHQNPSINEYTRLLPEMSSLFKSTTTYDPIFALLNADTSEERDKLTEKWVDHKLQELNFIGIVGALIAGVLTSTGSWPTVLKNGTTQPWTVRACWYCGTILALSSVLIAAQQSIRLHRLSCHKRSNTSIRRLLRRRKPCNKTGCILPRKLQVWAWQLSVLLLGISVLAMISGMFILIWSGTGSIFPSEDVEWWNGEAKLAVSFTIVFAFIFVLFMVEQVTLYTWKGEDDSDPDRQRMEQQEGGSSS
ncbi:hypothetical protein BT63DRAFT_426397 [Microthyrium microscopicum]|uniref:Uncharacterized protein n=1 Tax=Microthyrium microscopicum TaxID=703497 RepID=A0A6A6U5H7_9PEZI|nr:hypothetical protein BT63DRAFT_426397 [Microthyrium microscopicum]